MPKRSLRGPWAFYALALEVLPSSGQRGERSQKLAGAMDADQDRPQDDMSVLALSIGERPDAPQIRTLGMSVPAD